MHQDHQPEYFHWHCEVAALLLSALPGNAATKHHVRNALRMATLAAAGPNGVRFASVKAQQQQAARGLPWDKCDLIREHVVPIGEMYDQMLLSLGSPAFTTAPGKEPTLIQSTQRRTKLRAGENVHLLSSPRAWQIAAIVRQWSLMAYVTREEDALLRANKLHSRMPEDWDGKDKFARYIACGIRWVSLQ